MNSNRELSAAERAEQEKKRRQFENFMDDIAVLKKYLDDPLLTDLFVTGTGEIVIKKFKQGKIFTNEYMKPSQVRGIILSAAAILGKQIDADNGYPQNLKERFLRRTMRVSPVLSEKTRKAG